MLKVCEGVKSLDLFANTLFLLGGVDNNIMTEVRVSSPEKLRQYLPQIHAAGIIAVRLETTGNDA
ncbi:MAG: hypothetical protein LBJ00_17640, partial [Planctomycetaceae bacterium]|nr:hypothetical protein [Planctomycetaceae bacterium]